MRILCCWVSHSLMILIILFLYITLSIIHCTSEATPVDNTAIDTANEQASVQSSFTLILPSQRLIVDAPADQLTVWTQPLSNFQLVSIQQPAHYVSPERLGHPTRRLFYATPEHFSAIHNIQIFDPNRVQGLQPVTSYGDSAVQRVIRRFEKEDHEARAAPCPEPSQPELYIPKIERPKSMSIDYFLPPREEWPESPEGIGMTIKKPSQIRKVIYSPESQIYPDMAASVNRELQQES